MVEKKSSVLQKELVIDSNIVRLVALREKSFFFLKRIFDVIMSLSILILTLPILLITALLIHLGDRGPVIFSQTRTGKDGKNFRIYKFRSCTINNDKKRLNQKDEYTKIGKIIRKTSIDELPQLINILKGDMSFIGPRPWITEYYNNMNTYQRQRCNVLPGITGLAQANGRNNLTIFEKIDYDLKYVENCSIKQDIKIFFTTIKSVFMKTGIESDRTNIGNEIAMLKKYNRI